MIDKEIIAGKFFGGCKPKELQVLKYTTPKGNSVEALICRKPNRYLGSLYIYNVNGEDTGQFVPSMPKIHYLDNYHRPSFKSVYDVYFAREKLDGTCVILYALRDHDNDVIEIVPKSRGMGVLDKQFLRKYERIDTLLYEDYLWRHPGRVLLFELYGMGNIHSIEHMSTYLDLAFLGYYSADASLSYNNPIFFTNNEPDAFFSLSRDGDGFVVENDGLVRRFPAYESVARKTFDSLEDSIKDMQSQLESLNEDYYRINHRLAVEGVVLNYKDEHGDNKYLKIKPFTIEREHRSEGGIPRQYIMKELMKYLDEYGSIAKEEYEKSNKHYLDYMKRQLLEEFDELSIDKSEKKMLEYLEKRLYPRPKDDKIVKVCEELIHDYPSREIVEYMRLFSQEYPDMKKHSRKVYSRLEEML